MNSNVNRVPVAHAEQEPVQTGLQNLPRVQLEPQVQHDDPMQPQLVSEGKPQLTSAVESQLRHPPVAGLQQEAPQTFQTQPLVQGTETSASATASVSIPISVQAPVAEVSAPAQVSDQISAPVPVMIPEPVHGVVLPDSFVNTQQYARESTPAARSMMNTSSAPSGDAFSDLQARAKLAASRVHLMDATVDILVTTFKNKYTLDKELEKRCAKFANAAEFETSDRELREDLQILAGSSQWVKENLRYLEECLHEKHRNVQIAGPLIDARRERKKEDKQVKHIEKIAKKIEERAVRREKNGMEASARASEIRIVEDAWRNLQPTDGQ